MLRPIQNIFMTNFFLYDKILIELITTSICHSLSNSYYCNLKKFKKDAIYRSKFLSKLCHEWHG